MKAIFTISLSFLLSISSIAQCADSDKRLYGVKEMISDSMVFFAVNNEYSSARHYSSSIPEYANGAMAAAKNYVMQRSGDTFEKKCRVKYLYVLYPEGMSEDSAAADLYNISNYNVMYTVAFTVKQGEFDYDFEVEVDNDLNVISGDVLPSVKKNPSFDKFVDVCKALKTVKGDKQYKGVISGIGIAYDSGTDSFCWQIQEQPASMKTRGKYPVRDHYVNANTGKLISVAETQVYFIP